MIRWVLIYLIYLESSMAGFSNIDAQLRLRWPVAVNHIRSAVVW